MKFHDFVASTFDTVPPPTDQELSECSCDECRHGVSRFVGKEWRTLRSKDVATDQGDANINQLSTRAFHYFLPGFMILALKSHVDSFWIASNILERLASSDSGVGSLKVVQVTINQLSQVQRGVVAQFIERLRGDEQFCPVILASAQENLITGVAKPYPQQEVSDWAQSRLNAHPKPPDLASRRV